MIDYKSKKKKKCNAGRLFAKFHLRLKDAREVKPSIGSNQWTFNLNILLICYCVTVDNTITIG